MLEIMRKWKYLMITTSNFISSVTRSLSSSFYSSMTSMMDSDRQSEHLTPTSMDVSATKPRINNTATPERRIYVKRQHCQPQIQGRYKPHPCIHTLETPFMPHETIQDLSIQSAVYPRALGSEVNRRQGAGSGEPRPGVPGAPGEEGEEEGQV